MDNEHETVTVSENDTTVELANKTTKKKSNKTIITVVSIIIVIAIVVSIFGIQAQQKKSVETYKKDLETLSITMIKSAATAEEIGNLVKSVWYNAIFEEFDINTYMYTNPEPNHESVDFNTALANLFADDKYKDKIESIKTEQQNVTDLMKNMTNPPKQCEEAYKELKTYYNSYLELTNLVTNPTGSLQSFSDSFNEADKECVNCYNKMELYYK